MVASCLEEQHSEGAAVDGLGNMIHCFEEAERWENELE